MSLQKVILIVLIFTVSSWLCFGQGSEEDYSTKNWLKEYNIYPEQLLFHRFDRYSKEDIVKFREKLDLFKNTNLNDDWEGNYFSDNDHLGFSLFRLSSNVGFINLYIYTCQPELRSLNYGKILNTPEFIHLFPEFAENSPRKSEAVKYIKVKWNDRYYLVEESSLLAFAEKAVGIYVENEEHSSGNFQKWSNYWVKGDLEKELTEAPEFPANYKKYQRDAIETKIISVGKRLIEAEKEFGDKSSTRFFQNNAIYPVTIGAGKNKGVKSGMIFKIFQSGEEVFITKANQNNAVGFIARETDDGKNDFCRDVGNINEIPCRKIKPFLKIKTRVGYFGF